MTTEWNEDLHPRGPIGRFSRVAGRGTQPEIKGLYRFSTHDDDEDMTVSVGMIRVDPSIRGQGVARQLMTDLIERADREGRTITLSPSARDEQTSKEKLVQFYQSLGFVWNTGPNRNIDIMDEMYRRPR